MLSGKLTRDSQFAADDHRQFNRHGEAFDVGETFSGVDYETGLAAVEEIRALLPAGVSMAQFALRWILMFDAVTCAIPGGKRRRRCETIARPAICRRCRSAAMGAIRGIYDRKIRAIGPPAVVERKTRFSRSAKSRRDCFFRLHYA